MQRRAHADSRYERQQQIIEMLRPTAPSTAVRLERCAAARAGRRRDKWPWTCRSAGCQWCGPRLAMRWWRGLEQWVLTSGDAASLIVFAAHSAYDPVERARRLRRGLRDVRDRTAREDGRWRCVTFAGMVDAFGHAVIFVRHPGLRRDVIAARLSRRWPRLDAVEVGDVRPFTGLPANLAAALASARRGVEPLRIVVMPQRLRDQALVPSPEREPMPFIVG